MRYSTYVGCGNFGIEQDRGGETRQDAHMARKQKYPDNGWGREKKAEDIERHVDSECRLRGHDTESIGSVTIGRKAKP